MTNMHLAAVKTDSVVISLTRASLALIEALTIQQTKKIIDMAAAAEIYARRQKMGAEISDQATSVKIEALRKLGEMLQEAPKAKGELRRGAKSEPRETDAPTLAELGLTKKESAVAQKLAALPEKAFEEVKAGHTTIAKAIEAVNAEKANKPTPPKPPAPTIKPEALAEAQEAVSILSEENDRLNDRLAVEAMNASDEEKLLASTLIADLRAQIKTLTAELAAVKVSRDGYMRESAQLKRQVQMQRKELDKK